MSLFCSLRMTGGGKCKTGRKMVHKRKGVCMGCFSFNPISLQRTPHWVKHSGKEDSLNRLASAKHSRTFPSAHREEPKHPHLIKISLQAKSGNCFQITQTSTSHLNQDTSSSLHVEKVENKSALQDSEACPALQKCPMKSSILQVKMRN